jgi:hypothetical protein
VTSRNDDHGGSLLTRTNIFIHNLLSQCEEIHFPIELIIVEWNPPLDRPELSKVLEIPKKTGDTIIRIIQVPPVVHNTLANDCKLPLFQMIAKNVGIKRAKGDFILATNIDVLFSHELITFLNSGNLREGFIYRIDRTDVTSTIPLEEPWREQINFCRNQIIRIYKKYYIDGVSESISPWVFIKDHLLPNLHRFYRYLKYKEPILHLGAPGDFTLMSKSDWERTFGYPEMISYSLHLDSLFSYIAWYNGIQEVILRKPLELFHMEHSSGSGCTPGEGEKKLMTRLEKDSIPTLRHRDLIRYV